VFHTNKVNREFPIKNGTNLQNEEKNEKIYQKFNASLTPVYLSILSLGLAKQFKE
jgi:hypothetical protein